MRINEDFSQQPLYISDIRGEHKVIDFRYEPSAQLIYNDEPSAEEITSFNKWLRQHKDDYCILFHGTASRHDILLQGIKKTTLKAKRSFQSAPGFVYLSVFPDMSKTFGEFGYPLEDITVYGVIVKIKELKPDYDQLKNKRLYGDIDCGETLADSLVYGHGARVSRNIMPYEIRVLSKDLKHINEDYIEDISDEEVIEKPLLHNYGDGYDFVINIGVDFPMRDGRGSFVPSEFEYQFRKYIKMLDKLGVDYKTEEDLQYTDVEEVKERYPDVKTFAESPFPELSGSLTYWDADYIVGHPIFFRKFTSYIQYLNVFWYGYDLFNFGSYNVINLYNTDGEVIAPFACYVKPGSGARFDMERIYEYATYIKKKYSMLFAKEVDEIRLADVIYNFFKMHPDKVTIED